MSREAVDKSQEYLRGESMRKARELMQRGVYALMASFAPNPFRGEPHPEPGGSNSFSIAPEFRGDADAHLVASLIRVRKELVTEDLVNVDWDGKTVTIQGASQTFKGRLPRRIERLRPAFSEAFGDPVIRVLNDYNPPHIQWVFPE